jgi:DNA polymerase-3 subunit delta'
VSRFASVLKDGGPLPFADVPAWRGIEETLVSGNIPHCWAVSAPLAWQKALLEEMARRILCDGGRGNDGCAGCRGWVWDGEAETWRHPDLTVTGAFESQGSVKAGNVDACRALIRELPLKPVAARRRLGVVLAADALLPHAANSLLKIAEEPPSHACLLFLMERGDFLPTLRSRSRFTPLAAPSFFEPRPMPGNEAEWLACLESLNGAREEDLPALLSSWTSHLLAIGEPERGARAERLRLLVSRKKLSHSMVCDLLILALKEELPFEHILGGFW